MNQNQIDKSIEINGTYTVDGVEYVLQHSPQPGNLVDHEGARAVYEATANTVEGWLEGTDTLTLCWEITNLEADDGADACDWEDASLAKADERTHKENVDRAEMVILEAGEEAVKSLKSDENTIHAFRKEGKRFVVVTCWCAHSDAGAFPVWDLSDLEAMRCASEAHQQWVSDAGRGRGIGAWGTNTHTLSKFPNMLAKILDQYSA
jgi:hypothetical protein